MRIIYIKQTDEGITWRKVIGDEDEGWWSGVALSGVNIVRAANAARTQAQTNVAIAMSALPQDEPVSVAQEEYPAPSQQFSVAPRNFIVQIFDQDEVFAQAITFTPDEDYPAPSPPVMPTGNRILPIFDTPEYVFQPDEDYPAPGAAPAWTQANIQQPFFQADEFLPQAVTFVPDEDYALGTLVQTAPWIVPLYALFDSGDFSLAPVTNQVNYVDTGTHNYVSQDIESGVHT